MTRAKTDNRFAWIPAAAAAVVLLGGWAAPNVANRIENALYDRAMRAGGASPTRDIAIIAIDEESISRLGAWPWPRGIHAQLVDKLHEANVARIAFTSAFGETQQTGGAEQLQAALKLLESNDLGRSAQGEQLRKLLSSSMAQMDHNAELNRAIAKHGNVWLPVEAHIDAGAGAAAAEALSALDADRSYIAADAFVLDDAAGAADIRIPDAELAVSARRIAHVALRAESDGVVRSDVAALRVGDRLLPSMAVSVAAAMSNVKANEVSVDADGLLQFGRRSVQLDDALSWRPAYFARSGSESIRQYSYWQILSGAVEPSELSGKTVFVGLADAPVATATITPQHQAESPVHAIASATSSLYTGKKFQSPAWAGLAQALIAGIIVALAALTLSRLSLATCTLAGTLLALALILIEGGLLLSAGLWIKLTVPAVALLLAALIQCATRLMKRPGIAGGSAADNVESLRMLGLTFQGQGQLELAYETFRRCPADTQSLNLLYGLGQDYERRRQFNKAAEVYGYVASVDPNYKDIVQRRDRMKRADIAQAAGSKSPASAAQPAPRAAPRGDAPSVPVPKQVSQPAKQTLGRYEIERELGKGAMGVVYLGRDPKINRVVAIKAIALAEEFADEDLADARARFFREAEMAGRLNHPGIVTVYDAGEDRGLAYIAMEYLRGEHLSNYAEPINLLPAPRVLALVARVADALDYAHKQNVVHRDIKPANIMFNKETDELKITDFGIARLTDTSRTKTGIVLGTPSFMSPEQLEGRPLDGRSDLFSLGITLYQLLTGQLPFRADSMTRLMHKIATEDHVPLRSLRPELPEFADQIMSRALAKSAIDRYQSGAELAVALRTCIRLASRLEAVAR